MNIQRSERVLETIPVGSLGIIALPSCKNLGKRGERLPGAVASRKR